MNFMKNRYFLFLALLLLIGILAFWGKGVEFFIVPSSSMEPTLHPEDRVIVVRDKIRRGDIIVFKDPTSSSSSSFLIKRVVAVPEDKIKIENGKLYLNGKSKKEPYITEKMVYYLKSRTISEKHIFVLGDNRNNSADSSVWGELPVKNIIGKTVYIYWPPERMGTMK